MLSNERLQPFAEVVGSNSGRFAVANERSDLVLSGTDGMGAEIIERLIEDRETENFADRLKRIGFRDQPKIENDLFANAGSSSEKVCDLGIAAL